MSAGQSSLDLRLAARVESIAPGVSFLRGFCDSALLLPEINAVAGLAPWRHLSTRGGGRMSVAMTNCGPWGWHSDTSGYRYVDSDPLTGKLWPIMPAAFRRLAANAASVGGFAGFEPDCCLVNRYVIGAKMGTHRDFDELDLKHPIVSVSLGISATFLWYGARRSNKPIVVAVEDGDVLVWGGEARTGYHAVRALQDACHLLAGPVRYNLTFRRAR